MFLTPLHRTFVDVSMEPSLLDEKEAEERGHKYQVECSRADLGEDTILPLPTLVPLVHSSSSFIKAFQEPLVEPNEKKQVLCIQLWALICATVKKLREIVVVLY